MIYDIAIIGGGPAGYTAAERASANGLKTVLFEKKAIGGVCLNEGCIPTKTLLYSAKVLDTIKSAGKYGVSVDGQASFDLGKIIARKNKTIKKLAAGIRMRLSGHGVELLTGEAAILDEKDGFITLSCNDKLYQAKDVLLCTGSETIIPAIKGLSDVEFWTSKEALENKELPQSLAIIGGGVIGIEFASFFNSLGVKVSVIEMMPEILGLMDNELSALLRSEYEKKGIDFYLGTKVTEVTSTGLVAEKDSEKISIEAEKILVGIGRKPVRNTGLENLNIELFGIGVRVNEFMQTSHPHVYACGDITGYSLLAHTAVREAEVAINHILGLDDAMSYKAIPSVVYTNPEIAGVGRTEEELSAENSIYSVLKLPMSYSGRFVAENELGNGLCKLIVDENKKVIGCHILGNPASELIVIAGIAIEKGYTVDEFRKFVFPHPTVGEILHETLYI
ncbi:dihydrolipoyl dehydrogenase [Viscerimonas tarda]